MKCERCGTRMTQHWERSDIKSFIFSDRLGRYFCPECGLMSVDEDKREKLLLERRKWEEGG